MVVVVVAVAATAVKMPEKDLRVKNAGKTPIDSICDVENSEKIFIDSLVAFFGDLLTRRERKKTYSHILRTIIYDGCFCCCCCCGRVRVLSFIQYINTNNQN